MYVQLSHHKVVACTCMCNQVIYMYTTCESGCLPGHAQIIELNPVASLPNA